MGGRTAGRMVGWSLWGCAAAAPPLSPSFSLRIRFPPKGEGSSQSTRGHPARGTLHRCRFNHPVALVVIVIVVGIVREGHSLPPCRSNGARVNTARAGREGRER